MVDDIALAAEWGGARGGPASPQSKIRVQKAAIIILGAYNLKPNNVWGGGQISSVVMNPKHFQTGKYSKWQNFQSLFYKMFPPRLNKITPSSSPSP